MGDAFGYGFETPNDFGDQYNAIAFACRQIMAKYDTNKLVKVVAVTGGGEGQPAGTVNVQPLVQQIDGQGYGTDHGIVPGIPWMRVQGGKSGIIADPVVGDIGFVSAMDRDISKVKTTMAGALPGSRRRFNIADGIYVGGALNVAPTCYLFFTTDGHFKFVDVDGNVIQSSSSGIALTPKSGQPVTINGSFIVTGNLQLGGTVESQAGGTYAGNIHTTGTITADTDVNFAGISAKNHKHTGVTTGSGNTGDSFS